MTETHTTTICTVCGAAITEADTAPCDTSECPIPMPVIVAKDDTIIRGTFTEITVPVIAASKSASVNAMAKAHEELIRELYPLIPPRIHVNPLPEEFEDTADYILRVARVVDRWLLAVGVEVKCNSTATINLEMFKGQFVDAIEGWCTAEVDAAAGTLRDEYAEFEPARDLPREDYTNSLWRILTGAQR